MAFAHADTFKQVVYVCRVRRGVSARSWKQTLKRNLKRHAYSTCLLVPFVHDATEFTTEPPPPKRYGGRGLANAARPLSRSAAIRAPFQSGARGEGYPLPPIADARARRPCPTAAPDPAAVASLRVLLLRSLYLRGSIFLLLLPGQLETTISLSDRPQNHPRQPVVSATLATGWRIDNRPVPRDPVPIRHLTPLERLAVRPMTQVVNPTFLLLPTCSPNNKIQPTRCRFGANLMRCAKKVCVCIPHVLQYVQ